MPKFGPGEFTIGNEASAITASCLINSLTIAAEKDQGDSTTKLCGTVKPGAVTYSYTLSGNLDIDSDDAQGLWALSQSAKGSQLPFTFTPENGGTKATGTIVIDPLDFGGEDYGADMTSDFEWALVGEPEYAFQDAAATDAAWWERLVLTGEAVKDDKPVGPAVVTGSTAPATSSAPVTSSATSKTTAKESVSA